MTTQPDQNQPAPDPINYDPSTDRANPANWQQDAAPAPADAPAEEGEPKGEALEEALTAAGLAHTGTADEKRARLAEAQQQ